MLHSMVSSALSLKCIIRIIGSLGNTLILPKISHSISGIIANVDILLGIILFVLSFIFARKFYHILLYYIKYSVEIGSPY